MFAQCPVLVKQGRQTQLGGIRRQAVDVDLHDLPLWKSAHHLADVVLEPPDHDVFQHLLVDRHAAAEPLGIEDFQQSRKAVRVAVVRRGGEEQSVLEPRGQVADGAGDLRVDGVLLAAGGSGVVGLVEDQQRAAAELTQPCAKRPGVGLVDQQAVRDEEPGVRAPGIHAVTALAPHPGDIFFVEDLEGQPETALRFLLPLVQHRGRTANDDLANLLADEQFAVDEQGLDRLAQAHVVGNKQVDPRQEQGLAQRLKLVGVQADAGAKGRLKQLGVGGRNAVPPQRVQINSERPRWVEPPLGYGLPGFARDDFWADFPFPQHLQPLPLGVVVHARQLDQGAIAGAGRLDGLLDQVQPLADAGNLAGGGNDGGFGHLCLDSTCHRD